MKKLCLHYSYNWCQPIGKEDLPFFSRLLHDNPKETCDEVRHVCQSRIFILPIKDNIPKHPTGDINFNFKIASKGFSIEHHQIIQSKLDNHFYLVFRVKVDKGGYLDGTCVHVSKKPSYHHYYLEKVSSPNSPAEEVVRLRHHHTSKQEPGEYYGGCFRGTDYAVLEIC